MAARALFELAQGTLSCPVCFDLMDRPMCFRCGHVYCANCADRCISGRPMCPLCNSSVQNIRQARPLPALAKLVSFVRSLGGAADVPHSQGDTTFAVASKGGGKATNNALLVPPTTDNAPVSSFPRVNGADPQATAPNSSLDPGETEPSTPSTPLTHLHENGMSLGSQMAGAPTVQPSIAGEGRSQPVSTTMPPLQQQAQRQTWPSAEEVLPPPQHQPQSYRVEVERCIIRVEGAGGYALVYQGTCALCGLDISDRQQVSKLLRHVLTMDPSCNEGQVRLVSQRTLGLRLGPLWKLRFGAFGQASPSLRNGSDVNTREGAACGGQQSDGGPSSELPAVLLHQTCLEWCMLRRRIIEGANALTLNVAATVLQSLHAGDSETICSFCRIKIGACLVPCARCGRRSYHYPCALLTGAGDDAVPQAPLVGGVAMSPEQASALTGGKLGGKAVGPAHGKGKGKGKGKRGGKTGGKAGRRDKMTRAARADLNFPVGRIHSRLKDGLNRKQRCGASAAIYCAALLEYLTSEVIELAGAAAKAQKTERIKPRHLLLAIRGDEELNQIVNATIARGGVVPFVHKSLEKKIIKKSKRGS